MGFVFGSDNNNGPDSLTGPSLDNLMDNIPKLRLPEQFGPPEPQPEVYGPSQPEQFGPPQPPLATQSPSSSSNTIDGLINDAVQSNPLNKYLNYTYHFRLFVMGDGDANAAMVRTNVSADVGAAVAGKPQVTIAESGVTGYNIKEVVIQVAPPGNDISRQQAASAFTITVTEPNGISFLDAVAEAGNTLSLRNYTKAMYYLELTFVGYDDAGRFKPSSADNSMPNGGHWLWALQLTDVGINLTEAGAVYTIKALPTQDALWFDDTDILNAPAVVYAKGETLGALLDSFIDGLNKLWKEKYHGDLVVFDKVVSAPIGNFLAQPARVAEADPRKFKMKPSDPERHVDHNWSPDGGQYTVTISSGYSVPEFIIDAIKHTEEGQRLAIDNPVAHQPDQSGAATNERHFRESILWNIETVVSYPDWDKTTNNYQKHITFYLTPRYVSGNGALSRTEVDEAKDPQVQYGKVRSLVSNGLLRRRYDYVFTGLNTEVIDFKLGWKMTWSAVIPNYGGGAMKYEAFRINRRLNTDNTLATGGIAVTKPEESRTSGIVPASASSTTTDRTAFGPANNPELGGRTSTAVAANRTPFGSFNNPELRGSIAPEVMKLFAGPPSQEATQANIYIEDELENIINAKEFGVPVTLWQGNLDIINETGTTHYLGQASRDQSIAGAVWAQDGTSLTKESDYQRAKMTIRGDPFWLGQSNLQRALALQSNSTKVADQSTATPDHCQRVLLYFRYPLMTARDFKPAMKTSQVFNGIYQVVGTLHTFSEGAFKTELDLSRDKLADPKFWTGDPNKTNGGEGSPPISSITPNAAQRNFATSPGASPQPGVDYTPGDPVSFTKAFLPLAQQESARTGLAPEVVLAQAGHESNWGKSTPGNNFFGIKGTGGTYQTTEIINGQAQTANASFAGYQTSADSFAGFGDLMLTKRYSRVASAGDYPAQIQAIAAAGYATDPNYARKVTAAADKVHGIISTL